jgi:hypothetical protein
MRAFNNADDRLGDVVNVSEVAPQPTVVEQPERCFICDCSREYDLPQTADGRYARAGVLQPSDECGVAL